MLNNYTDIFKPQLAIVAYQGERENRQEWYLESHPIVEGQMLEGRPLQQETLHAVLALMYDEHKAELNIHKFIPQNMVYADLLHGGDYNMIWYRPEERRMIYFGDHGDTEKIKYSGVAWAPAMLYIANRKQLSVFALKSNDYPTEETKLCRAPFFNVNGGSGNVCLGSAQAVKPKEPSYASLMKYWEDIFWGSNFTGGADNWQKAFADENLKFDAETLKEQTNFPKTLKDLMK